MGTQPVYKAKQVNRFTAILFVSTAVLVSCTRAEFSVKNTYADSFETSDGRKGVYVWSSVDTDDAQNLRMQVRDPSGALVWTPVVQCEDYSGLTLYGSSDIMMPDTSSLPYGVWKADYMTKDGRTRTVEFEIKQDK